MQSKIAQKRTLILMLVPCLVILCVIIIIPLINLFVYSFYDYKLSTFMDHPDFKAAFIENYEPTSAYGTKALGEPPTCSPAPAIRNAILQAAGVALNEIPMRPHLLFDEFKKAELI